MTILGIISLAGIVVNNAIILLDRIKMEIDVNGLNPPDAIIQAAQRCLRPILITTATTIAGLMPLWLFGGPMWEPMAIAIIFGLAFCTLLTLGVVPVLYPFFLNRFEEPYELAFLDRSIPRTFKIAQDILRYPRTVAETLRLMHRWKVLDRYMPEFGRIRSLVKFDRYHQYTVDEHTLYAIENLEKGHLGELQDGGIFLKMLYL